MSPLVVPPKDAFRLIGVKRTKGFELLRNGPLEKVRQGSRSIGVTMASIKAYVAARTVARSRLPECSRDDLAAIVADLEQRIAERDREIAQLKKAGPRTVARAAKPPPRDWADGARAVGAKDLD